MVSFNQLAIVGGFMVVYFVNYFISRSGGSDAWLNEVGWRWMFASEVIPAGLFFILLFLVVLGLPFYLGYLIGKRKSNS